MSESNRKSKLEGYQDRRHNLDEITGDKALDEIDFYNVKSVSYTHLTLPTIYSV